MPRRRRDRDLGAVRAGHGGDYGWSATYSGDTNNDPVGGDCGDLRRAADVDAGDACDRDGGDERHGVGNGTLVDTATVTSLVNPS